MHSDETTGGLPLTGEPGTDQIEAWRRQYGVGNIIRLEADLEPDEVGAKQLVVYCRKPNPQHLNRFTKTVQSDSYRGLREMVFDTLLWPDADTLKATFERLPGLVVGIGTELQRVLGTNTGFTTKRF